MMKSRSTLMTVCGDILPVGERGRGRGRGFFVRPFARRPRERMSFIQPGSQNCWRCAQQRNLPVTSVPNRQGSTTFYLPATVGTELNGEGSAQQKPNMSPAYPAPILPPIVVRL